MLSITSPNVPVLAIVIVESYSLAGTLNFWEKDSNTTIFACKDSNTIVILEKTQILLLPRSSLT